MSFPEIMIVAISLAMDHLVGLGHERIGFVGQFADEPLADSLERSAAFRELMEAKGLPLDPAWTYDYDHAPELDLPGFLEGLSSAPPSALIAFNDIAAVHLCRGLDTMGLAVPADVSVVGVDDSFFCDLVSPPLTSVRQPAPEIGAAAAVDLIRRVQTLERGGLSSDAASPPTPEGAEPHVFAPELVVRGSTGPPRG